MPNQEHLRMLEKGAEGWNKWRDENPKIVPDLNEANLARKDLHGYNLAGAELISTNLHKADLSEAVLAGVRMQEADLSEAHFLKADLMYANLTGANLQGAFLAASDMAHSLLNGADLRNASLVRADLYEADLSSSDIEGADLRYSILTSADLRGANLSGCRVYAVSAWNIITDGTTTQGGLEVTEATEDNGVTVDNIEVAHFINMIITNEKLRDIINVSTSKIVLILGNFRPERKEVLDAIKAFLRNCDLVPVLFDFEIDGSRDMTETVLFLANMSCFIVADITEARCIPQELTAIAPNVSTPIQPIIFSGTGDAEPYAMFEDLKKYRGMQELYQYRNLEELLAFLDEEILPKYRT